MRRNTEFCKDHYRLPELCCEEWLGWIMASLANDIEQFATCLAEGRGLIDDYGMESYHLPVCHAGTIGRLSKLEEMICPPGLATFDYHTILKDDSLQIALAHPSNTRMKGDRRRTTFLLAVYPSLLVTLTPGYFWHLSLHPRGGGRVHIVFGAPLGRAARVIEE